MMAGCRKAYAPLVEAGYVEVVYGGTKEGAFLTNHDIVKSIHLTGSTATYDAVVWGGKKKVPHHCHAFEGTLSRL
jgi:acyl-CoA reductase-like NAD-dependent aldehyde dehydrogenase